MLSYFCSVKRFSFKEWEKCFEMNSKERLFPLSFHLHWSWIILHRDIIVYHFSLWSSLFSSSRVILKSSMYFQLWKSDTRIHCWIQVLLSPVVWLVCESFRFFSFLLFSSSKIREVKFFLFVSVSFEGDDGWGWEEERQTHLSFPLFSVLKSWKELLCMSVYLSVSLLFCLSLFPLKIVTFALSFLSNASLLSFAFLSGSISRLAWHESKNCWNRMMTVVSLLVLSLFCQ